MRRALAWGGAVVLVAVALVSRSAAVHETTPQATGKVETGPAGVYKALVKKVEYSQDGGKTWAALTEPAQEVDVASVKPGDLASRYASGSKLVSGTYNKIQVTMSCTIKLKGKVTFDGTTHHTTSAGGTSTNAAALAEGSYTLPSHAPDFCTAGEFTTTQDVNFTLTQGTTTTVCITFNLDKAIRLDGAPFAAAVAPNTVSVTITVPVGAC